MKHLVCSLFLVLSLTSIYAQDPVAESAPLLPIAAAACLHDAQTVREDFRLAAGCLPPDVAADWNVNQAFSARVAYDAWPDPLCGDGIRSELARDLAAGKRALLPPAIGAPGVVLLVGPYMNSGESWGPVEYRRKGNTVTIVVESWTDDRARRRNILQRFAYVLPLGVFHADRIELVVELRPLVLEVARDPVLYSERNPGSARLVVRPGSEDVPATQGAFAFPAVAEAPGTPSRQPPVFHVRPLDMDATPGFSAGTFDLSAWMAQTGRNEAPPTLSAAGPDDRLFAAIVGPEIDSYCGVSLRRVTWDGRRARLLVDVWTDHGGRDKNIPWRPVLVVPLTPPGDPKSGGAELDVEWRVWVAPTQGEFGRLDEAAGKRLAAEADWHVALMRK